MPFIGSQHQDNVFAHDARFPLNASSSYCVFIKFPLNMLFSHFDACEFFIELDNAATIVFSLAIHLKRLHDFP